ncbi:MAG: ATP-binding protein [Phycisphaerales bacterium]
MNTEPAQSGQATDDATTGGASGQAFTLEQLLSIIGSARDAIITVDEHQRVVLFNASAEREFGVSASEAIGSPLERFIPSRFRAAHALHVREFARTGANLRDMGHSRALSGLRADGSEFPIEASISRSQIAGRQLLTVILRDISGRHALEAQLLQSQKMEVIGRFAGGVAHDFNNLLMVIFNYVALAQGRLEHNHPARSALAQVQEAAQAAAGLTRQLLAFARKQPMHRRVMSPHAAIVEIEPMLRRLLDESVRLRTALARDTGNIEIDPSQFQQVLVNLVVNAKDAMPRGGELLIECENAAGADLAGDQTVGVLGREMVTVRVRDTGVGMSADVREKMFEPFFTTKPEGKGTGLGLATCHGIVKQAGGRIEVQSEVGKGTCVSVLIPRVGGSASHAPVSVPAQVPTGNEAVLVVEDSELVRRILTEVLGEAGYRVLEAESGEQAVALAERGSGRIDLLISDVVMPGMSGPELAAWFESHRPGVPVILMSGHAEDALSRYDLTRAVFLAKPFRAATLLHAVRDALDSHAKRGN